MALSCDAIQVYRGLETLSGAATLARARPARASPSRLRGSGRGVQRRPVRGRWRTRRSTDCSPTVAARSSSGAPACTCERRWPTSTCARRYRPGCAPRSSGEIADRGAGGDPRRARPDGRPQRVHPQRPQAHRAVARAPARGPRPAPRQRPALDGEGPPSDDSGRPRHAIGRSSGRASTAESTRCSPRGARDEARSAVETGASRTARAALGFDEFLAGDVEGVKRAHRRYARRQLTWMRQDARPSS